MSERRSHVVGEGDLPMAPLPEGGGSFRVAIDASAGCRNLLQRVLRIEPGRTGEMQQETSEDVLYLAEGEARALIGDGKLDLRPGTGALIPPGVPYAFENPGPGEAVLVSVLAPQPGEGEPLEPGGEAASVREADEEPLPAGQDRTFKLMIDPRYGSRTVTQFVGFIDRSRAPFHTHTYEEAIYILEGEGLVHVEDGEIPIAKGSSVFLSPGTPHCLENRSEGVLRLLGVFSPPGSPADKSMMQMGGPTR